MVEIYVKDIRNALKNKSYFSALALSLMLPDICGMVEYPNKQVYERYIGWYDKYIGDYLKDEEQGAQSPYLSGEMVYNLRNTYFHQGSPNVNVGKVQENVNQVDKFVLTLGDGTKFHSMAFSFNVGPVACRMLQVEVTYLCDILCDRALAYYINNHDKFIFDANVFLDEDLSGKKSPSDNIHRDGDPIGDIIKNKFISMGHDVILEDNLTEKFLEVSMQAFTGGVLNRNDRVYIENVNDSDPIEITTTKKKLDNRASKPTRTKEELDFRSFFGIVFKEKKYKNKKEQIIEAYLTSKTKNQLNNKLLKVFKGKDVKIILERLQSKIKDWPGQ